MKREEGFYWGLNWYNRWIVAEWKIKPLTGESYWEVSGFENEYDDRVFQEINEQRLEPPTT